MKNTIRWQKLVMAGSAVCVLFACKPERRMTSEQSGKVIAVNSFKIQAAEREVDEEVMGSVRTKVRAVVEAKVSGRIAKMPVVLGQKVSAGDLLAEIDAQEILARFEQASAQRDQAAQDLERATSLMKKQVSSKQEFDAAQAKFRVADATVREAGTMLGYARVTAPFDGVISRKLTDVGDLATPGKPLLEIEDRGTLRFEADVPEALMAGISSGQNISVTVPATKKTFEAVVVEISPTADAGSRTFLIKLDLPQSEELRAGQFGRVAIPVGKATSMRVPASSVIQRGQMELVFVIGDGHAKLRIVKSGRHFGQEVEILSGVAPGEEIVLSGLESLSDGSPVEVRK